ncbi:unnamed protein product [Rodentolepis nana]|uniref:General secretion pathway protein n=1 Tax=Rodentolepis nana TaxID=102285 RepID=A0A0R3TK41_RODNA|nr:unnamed protein product [Rodentolepis nana]
MHALRKHRKQLHRIFSSENQLTASEFKDLTERIDELSRRKFIYFNLCLNEVIVKNGEEYKEITELIDGLRTRALLLRRQFIYFNLYPNKVIVENGAEYETLHCFIRRFSLSVAELEEYRQDFEHRYHEQNSS